MDYSALGLAGSLTRDEAAQLEQLAFDTEAYQSIGIAGPVTPSLLLRIAELGAGRVADAVHAAVAGPVDPDELEVLLDLGLERVGLASNDGPADSAGELIARIQRN